jgi:translation initiation factor 2 subunit 2
MHRQLEHVMSFILAELGTDGSIDGSQRLVIKGRYVPKVIESLLKKYIVDYVTCHMCRNADTTLSRDSVTRLYFIQCESCGSSRSVAPIKAGFHATMRTDRRKVKASS